MKSPIERLWELAVSEFGIYPTEDNDKLRLDYGFYLTFANDEFACHIVENGRDDWQFKSKSAFDVVKYAHNEIERIRREEEEIEDSEYESEYDRDYDLYDSQEIGDYEMNGPDRIYPEY